MSEETQGQAKPRRRGPSRATALAKALDDAHVDQGKLMHAGKLDRRDPSYVHRVSLVRTVITSLNRQIDRLDASRLRKLEDALNVALEENKTLKLEVERLTVELAAKPVRPLSAAEEALRRYEAERAGRTT